MGIIEELKQQFKVANVAGLGTCIVIPVDKFNPEWDQQILDAGKQCHAQNDYVHVILGHEKIEKTNVLSNFLSPHWSKEEEDRLLKRWNELTGTMDRRSAKLVSEFPGRTAKAIELKYRKLKRAKKQKETPKPEPVTSIPISDPNVTKILGKLTSDVDGILDILDEQNKVMNKLSCQVLMQALQLKEGKGEFAIPDNLWVHYADALLEDDKKFCGIFREKAKHLLESSS